MLNFGNFDFFKLLFQYFRPFLVFILLIYQTFSLVTHIVSTYIYYVISFVNICFARGKTDSILLFEIEIINNILHEEFIGQSFHRDQIDCFFKGWGKGGKIITECTYCCFFLIVQIHRKKRQ